MSIQSEQARDSTLGRYAGINRAWTRMDPRASILGSAERKARKVAEGAERFDRDEIHALLAYFVRNA